MNREGMEEQTGQRRTSNYALIRAHSKYMYKKKSDRGTAICKK